MKNEIFKYPIIETERLVLKLPSADAAPYLLTYVQDNVEHFAPWSPPRTEKYYTESFWQEKLSVSQDNFREGKALELVIFPNKIHQVLSLDNATLQELCVGHFKLVILVIILIIEQLDMVICLRF